MSKDKRIEMTSNIEWDLDIRILFWNNFLTVLDES